MSTRANSPTSKTPIIASPALKNLRRRIVPLASTAAALGLSGCGMLGLGHHAPVAADQDTSNTVTISADSTAEQVKAFTAGMDQALSQIDKNKLRGAAGSSGAAGNRGATPGTDGNAAAPDSAVAAALTVPSAPVTPPRAMVAAPATIPGNQVVFSPVNSLGLPLQLGADTPVLNLASWPPPISGGNFTGMPVGLEQPGILGPESALSILPAPVIAPATAVAEPRVAESAAPGAAAAAPDPSLDAALEVIRRHVAAHPSLDTALALALLENDDGHAPDPAPANALSADDQQVLQGLLGALHGMNQEAAPSTLAERTAPLFAAATKWQADADLSLPKLVLTSRVDSYGVYTPVDPKFTAGQKQTVIVYCEVAHFSPKKTADGWYDTRLSQQETLATEDGLLLWRPNAEVVEDRSRNLRRDFYLVKKLTIPDNLAVGKYALRMSVTDLNTNKIAVVTLPIEIVK